MENDDPDFCYYSFLPSPSAYQHIEVSEPGRKSRPRKRQLGWGKKPGFIAIHLMLNKAHIKSTRKQSLSIHI